MGVYRQLGRSPAPQQMGAVVQVDTNWLLWGIGALALGMFLFGTKSEPKLRAQRESRRSKKISTLKKQIKALEA